MKSSPTQTDSQKHEVPSPRSDSEIIDEASKESFPASDPPAHTPVTGCGNLVENQSEDDEEDCCSQKKPKKK